MTLDCRPTFVISAPNGTLDIVEDAEIEAAAKHMAIEMQHYTNKRILNGLDFEELIGMTESKPMFAPPIKTQGQVLLDVVDKMVDHSQDGRRRDLSGQVQINPNDKCPCGSNRKFKKCCYSNRL